MNKINYIEGDATNPKTGEDVKIICHVCNDVRKWGAGFTNALSKKWNYLEKEFKETALNLGDVLFIQTGEIWVANMVAQKGVRSKTNPIPIDYNALHKTLNTVAEFAVKMKASIHGPKFGAGLAGGDWNKIESIINDTLIKEGVKVFIYNLPK